MPDRTGQQLGNYRLLRLLGRGGFAEVYLDEHVYLKRRAALKVLHIALEEEDVEHFLAEAQVLARLDHPNIVRVHEFAVEQGTPFLVMDYAPRGTLRQRHPRGSCLSLQTTVAYVKQVAAALQYAHNHQVIHRDVKPENMLLGAQQELLLSDFGISLLSPSPEQLSTQELAGTLPYMAPEQIRGKPGFASDQYSLAVIVYEWLCGVRPFEGAAWQIVYQQVSLAPAPLREHDSSLPETVEVVVLKALAKDPRERYVSVQLFAQALERASQVSWLGLDAETEVTVSLDAISPAASSTPPAISRRIFLSAAPEDEAFATRLTSDLQQRGIAVWNEDPEITQNLLEQENGARRAIRAVDVVLLVVSPGTPSSRSVREHLRIASLYQRQLVFVWAAGEEIAAVLPDAWGRAAQIDLVDARNGRNKQALDEIVAYLEAMPVEELALTEPAEELREPRNPYKGLRPFTHHDASDFFGRDSLIAELVERLREVGQPSMPQARLLAVIGPSGSGKSSVVMAGLLPRLQQGALPGSEHWVYLETMVPGTHPLEELMLTLSSRFPERSLKTIREDLQDESARGLHLLASQLVKAPEQKVVLLIDQFEELFTQTTAEEERGHFIDLLVTAMAEPQGAVIVILTLRADLYDRPMSYPALGRLIVQRQVLVWPMEVHDLRAVIKRPAALPDAQLSFEGTLVGDLLFEVQGQVGALPLLQFTLEQLFERRNGHTLTLQAYQEIGGVKGALAKHAEMTYAALPSEEHRRLARALFLRLIDPGLTEQDTTRRRAAFTEVSLPDSRQTALLKEMADAFIAARLLTTNEAAGITTIEVSHEALIREWTRLADWLREAREDIRLQQTLSEDSAEWARRDKPRDRLYRGSQLKDARAWAKRNIPSTSEVAFLHASATQSVRSIASVLAVLLLVISSIGTAGWFVTHQAPNPTIVTNLLDDGPGSLRWDIANAPSGSTITFATGILGTIKLTSGDLNVHRNLTIRGPGPVISSTNGKINVNGSIVASISDLTLINRFSGEMIYNSAVVTLTNIHLSASVSSGSSGIANAGTLKLINSSISGGSRDGGGGIVNQGKLTLTNSTISGNFSTSDGGGIFNNQGGTITLMNSSISDNGAGCGNGGGIYNAATLTLTNSTISGNIASTKGVADLYTRGNPLALIERSGADQKRTVDIPSSGGCSPPPGGCNGGVNPAYPPPGGCGGGIYSGFGEVTLTNTTISGNTATDGGGIYNDVLEGYRGNPLAKGIRLTNSTLSHNTATRMGGGIAVAYGEVDITFCTIYGNNALDGGGISMQNNTDRYGRKGSGQVQLSKSIIAGDHAHINLDISGMLTSDGYNLIQDTSGVTIQESNGKADIFGASLNVGPLQNNGGPTQTLALLPNSPALDQIPRDACLVNGITTDQRGMRRPDGKEQFCDIGAYESSY